MKYRSVLICTFLMLLGWIASPSPVMAMQKDTIPKSNGKALLEQVMKTITRDTSSGNGYLKKLEKAFIPYTGMVIRNINMIRLPFGTPIHDTSRSFQNTLTQWANDLHHLTREKVIRKNLFFQPADTINPYLMGDNERYLRELSYLQDARITVDAVPHTDSVDVTILVKDIFSIGGAIGSLGIHRTDVNIRDDNISGTGHAAIIYGLYDDSRKNNFAFGGEIIRRNMGGKFINLNLGYRSYFSSIPRTPKQENHYFIRVHKPLLHRYMKWTYELNAAYNTTRNQYLDDSIYYQLFRYSYYDFETWAGYNFNTEDVPPVDENRELHRLIGIRAINRKFLNRPPKYDSVYNWRFADLAGILTTLSLFRQNFYKAQYVYGFGINEDIPVGLLLNLITGYTIKNNVSRPFLGINYQRYGFTPKKHYVGWLLRGEGHVHEGIEDINLMAGFNFFSRLKKLNERWKQRFFLTLNISQQINTVLNEPLLLNSEFGLPEYGGRDISGGNFRSSVRAESVFFSPWNLANFRFAPVLFGNAALFQPYKKETGFFSSIGLGLRTRNESLIFGTIEIKGLYFPQQNAYGDHFGLELSTNIIFENDIQFIKKPDFIRVN